MSLYNEEKVIQEKLDCLLALDYPKERLKFYIGSDCSMDATNEIVAVYAKKHANIHFFPFANRRGKPGVINDLAQIAKKEANPSQEHVFIITDANVMLEVQTLKKLIRHFANPKIVVVDAHMVNKGMQQEGISKSENQYISSEVQLKHDEGLLWGKMIGPFGGCYAIRANWYSPVPEHFLVDDFYITMRVLEREGLTINDLEAICFEGIPHRISDEYRRKVRISAGNYQNLKTFAHLWIPRFRAVNFAFFSHKVLRWWGPFFILISTVGSAILAYHGNLLSLGLFFFWMFFLVIIPASDAIFKKLNIHILLLRNVTYFVSMNIALAHGFFRYLNGIKVGTWEPTVREK